MFRPCLGLEAMDHLLGTFVGCYQLSGSFDSIRVAVQSWLLDHNGSTIDKCLPCDATSGRVIR